MPACPPVAPGLRGDFAALSSFRGVKQAGHLALRTHKQELHRRIVGGSDETLIAGSRNVIGVAAAGVVGVAAGVVLEPPVLLHLEARFERAAGEVLPKLAVGRHHRVEVTVAPADLLDRGHSQAGVPLPGDRGQGC